MRFDRKDWCNDDCDEQNWNIADLNMSVIRAPRPSRLPIIEYETEELCISDCTAALLCNTCRSERLFVKK